ncbi:MAG: DEAD/DEAH box helicase family protein [Tenericutes bacterium]|jgi:competence protein ComFA|nr:DEAD/DEAH box helicase family protein [Mycoplasmatota bacterium]
MIEKVIYRNSVRAIKAVEDKCNRCMSHHIVIAENQHHYCEDCYENQIMSDHLYLERYERTRKQKEHVLKIDFDLAESQLKGSRFIKNCYERKDNGYLHAVCGAGKTEMCLETILNCLNEGKSIVFVIPRVEIIKQLYERFNTYFPKTTICALYQDMSFNESADIYISTPQQLIKFYHEFNLMIIDEADAFPYYQNKHLYRLVNKALNPNGVLIYISATMPDDYKKMIDSGEMNYCLIPFRFHQKDLVIPSFKKYQYMFSNKLLMLISDYRNNQKRLLIYFPSIHLMSKFRWFLLKQAIDTEMISSQTLYKNEVLKRFENSEYNILLTTTLLERGVTFTNCNVFVIEADHKIFDKDTLIQIAGRVGRDKKYSTGELIFLSRFITTEMKQAKIELIKLNKVKNNDLQVM